MLNYSVIKKSFDVQSLPVQLDEIKSFLGININNPEQDKLLSKLSIIATNYAEDSMQCSVMKNKMLICFNQGSERINQRVNLPLEPILLVNNVRIFKPNSLVSIDFEHMKDYFFMQNLAAINFITRIPYLSRVEIEYDAGYANVESVPSQIKEGILRHIDLMYNKSDDVNKLSIIKYLYSDFKQIKL